jgi:hypothetical protein
MPTLDPERLSSKSHQHYVQYLVGELMPDGVTPRTEFFLDRTVRRIDEIAVYVGGSESGRLKKGLRTTSLFVDFRG